MIRAVFTVYFRLALRFGQVQKVKDKLNDT